MAIERDEQLKQAYAALLVRRARTSEPPAVDPAIIQQLAECTYRGDDRDQLLDSILSDPRTTAEFDFFFELASSKPRRRKLPAWLAAAASVLLLLGAAATWRIMLGPAPEPLRSTNEVTLEQPAPDAIIQVSTPFRWRAVAAAEAYRFELIDDQGDVVYDTLLADTVLVLPPAVSPAAGETHVWWITAQLRDGTATRSTPRRVHFQP